MRKYWLLIASIVGVVIILVLIFQFLNYTELTLNIKTSGIFDQENLLIKIDDKEYPVNDWKVLIPRIKKGSHNFEIYFYQTKILEKELSVSDENKQLSFELPNPPEISKVDYSYDENRKVLTITWKVSGDIKADVYEVFKDGKKVGSTSELKYTEEFGPFESHLYEIKPVFFNKIYGASYKVEIGPFREPAHLYGRIILPFDIEAERMKVEFDSTEATLTEDYKFEAKDIIPGVYDFKILIDGNPVLTYTSTVVSGENEILIELPDLPEIEDATMNVNVASKKLKISWKIPENKYYKSIKYIVKDSMNHTYETVNNFIEIPWETSEASYSIVPVFFESVIGKILTLYKPAAPVLDLQLPQRYNKKDLDLEIPSKLKDVEIFVKVDENEWIKSNEIHDLTDGEHIIFIKTVDKFNQTFESSYTVFVDATPPIPPMGVKAKYEEGKLEISWLPSISEDVERYIVSLSEPASITYEGTNLVVYDFEKSENIPDSIQVKVIAKDYYDNMSQKILKVDIPKIPDTLEKELNYLNEGNDVNLKLKFSKFNGRIYLYLNDKEVYSGSSNELNLELKDLEFDKDYVVSAEVVNDIGKSFRREILKFKTPLSKPKILEIRQTGVNEVLVKVEAVGDYIEYNVNSSEFSIVIQSPKKEELIALPQPGEYIFTVRAFSQHNQSLISDAKRFDVLPARNELPDTIDERIIVSKEGGPYLISKDIQILKNGELILGKDVELVFSEISAIQVHGKLLVNNLKITDNKWLGIKAYEGSYVEIRGLELSDLDSFVQATDASVSIISSKFDNLNKVIEIQKGKLIVEDSNFISTKNPVRAMGSEIEIRNSTFSKYDFAVEAESSIIKIDSIAFNDGKTGLYFLDSTATLTGIHSDKNIEGIRMVNSNLFLKDSTFNSNVKGISTINSILTVVDSTFKNNQRATEIQVEMIKPSPKIRYISNRTGELLDSPVRFFYDSFENNKTDIYVIDGSYPVVLKACKGAEKIFDFRVSPFYRKPSGILKKRSEVIFDAPDKINLKIVDENRISLPLSDSDIKILDRDGKMLRFKIEEIYQPQVNLPEELKLLLLIDLSDSIADQAGESLEELEELIENIKSNFKNTEIFVFNSNWVRKVDKNWKLQRREVWGYTPLYDTILTLLNSQVVKNIPYGIVVITDGLDSDWQDKTNGSVNSVDKLLQILTERNIPISFVIYGETNIFRNSLTHVNRDFEKIKESKTSVLDWRQKELLAAIEDQLKMSYSSRYQITLEDVPSSSKVKLLIQKNLIRFNRIIRIPYYPIETDRDYRITRENIMREFVFDLLTDKTAVIELND